LETARQYRAKNESLGENHPEQKKLREQIEKLVQQAFNIRQELQSQELKQLQERIAKVEQSLAKRSQNRDAIIERRTKELLEEDRDLEWSASIGLYPALNPAPVAIPVTRPDGSNVTVYGTPSVLPAPVPVPAAGPPASSAPQSQTVLPPAIPQLALPSGADQRRAFVDMATQLQQAEAEISNLKAHLKSDALEQNTIYQAALRRAESAKRTLDLLKREMDTQMKLLQLDLQAAENELQAVSAEFRQKSELQKRGVVTSEEVVRAQAAIEHAQIRVSRAKILLELQQETMQESGERRAESRK
jgi:hypothetical protein